MRKLRHCKPLKDRFLAFISVDKKSGCWNWTGTTSNSGYGTIGLGRKGQGKGFAHRVSWELFRGSIPEGHFVCHHCDNKLCVNPDHLFTGTQLDNLKDAISKGRMCSGQKWKNSNRKLAWGEKHGRHVLTEDQVIQIHRTFWNGGVNFTQLASEFGVSRMTISNIINRRNWKRVIA